MSHVYLSAVVFRGEVDPAGSKLPHDFVPHPSPSSLVANASVWHTLVRLLLEAGLSVSALDHNDYSALHLGTGNSRVCPPRPVQPSSFATAVDPYAEAHPHCPRFVAVRARLCVCSNPSFFPSRPLSVVIVAVLRHFSFGRGAHRRGAAVAPGRGCAGLVDGTGPPAAPPRRTVRTQPRHPCALALVGLGSSGGWLKCSSGFCSRRAALDSVI